MSCFRSALKFGGATEQLLSAGRTRGSMTVQLPSLDFAVSSRIFAVDTGALECYVDHDRSDGL